MAGDVRTDGRVRRHSDHKQRVPFTPGRRKHAQSVKKTTMPRAGAAVGSTARRATGGGWMAVKRAVTFQSCAARLAVPAKLKMNEEHIHKSAGATIRSTTATDRWDVQQMYEKLFSLPSTQNLEATDPWSQKLGTHADDPAAERKSRDRLHVLRTLKRKFKRTLINLLDADADWEELFHLYDTDGDGGIGLEELTACIRCDANVSEEQLSADELRDLFDYINADGSGEISAEEFGSFMDTPMAETRAPLPISGNVNRSTPRHASPKASRKPMDGSKEAAARQPAPWLQQFVRPTQKALPSVAEYMTNARVPLRADCFADSEVIGYLKKGEVVAVTHIWGGNEFKCHRLRCYDPRRGMAGWGWTSHRGKLRPTDKTSELLSRLSRDEWSTMCEHYAYIADRVATLEARARLAQQMPCTRSQTTLPQEDAPEEEVDAATPQEQGHTRTMRVYASIDRALVLHQIAAQKLECRAGLEPDVHAKHNVAQRPTDTDPWPAPPSTSTRTPDSASTSVAKQPTRTTAQPAFVDGEARGSSARPPKIPPPESAMLCETTRCTHNTPNPSCETSLQKPKPPMETSASTSDSDTAWPSTGVVKLHVLPPESATLCKHMSSANASCANSLWRKPTPSAPTSARCSSPPPRSARSHRPAVCT